VSEVEINTSSILLCFEYHRSFYGYVFIHSEHTILPRLSWLTLLMALISKLDNATIDHATCKEQQLNQASIGLQTLEPSNNVGWQEGALHSEHTPNLDEVSTKSYAKKALGGVAYKRFQLSNLTMQIKQRRRERHEEN
jgi:hypothetical protein